MTINTSRREVDGAIAIECLGAIRLVLATPTLDGKKIEAITKIIENEAPAPDMADTNSVTIFLRQITDEEAQ